MSGNEITGIHNFFEENSSHQSQVTGSSHIISSINPWIGTQAMSRVIPSSDIDSDQRNVRLPFQAPFGIGLSQFDLKQHINRNQSKNQQLNSNELMHVSTALQGMSGQGKFQRDGAVPENISLMQRGLANFVSQEGNSTGYGSGFPGSLEKPDVTASPVSFDFLGGHQQLSGQHPGISQPHQMHQQGSNDMHWKQHLIAMQMQEIQRQQQFQQLHLGARQHSSFNQMYGATGQGAADELPSMLSGMPVANAVNYMPGELMGSQSKSPNNAHLLIAGNMNWAQRNIPMIQGIPNGLIYSQDQVQSMHSMGFIPRQLDQSLHGTPVSGTIGSLNHYFQIQGLPNDSASVDLMSKLGENHAERASVQSSALNDFHNDQRPIPNEGYSGASFVAGRQGAQGKTLFGNALVQGTDSRAASGSIHQSNHLAENIQVQEFQDGQAQTDWLGKSHDSITAQVAPSHTRTALDPTEEKILFGVDDNANWDAPLGGSSNRVAGTYLNGYPMQNNDCLNVFPSLQSGTWSALVQEALEVSSSDTGQQEEWSGLSLQKAEQQAGNHLVLLSNNDKQNAVRDAENNLHDTLRSKHFPLLSNTTARQYLPSMPTSQQPIKYSYEQNNERLETDHSIQSVQQLPKETSDAQFSQNYQPYNFIGNSLQERQRHLNASNDVWVVQEHQQAMQHMDSAEMGSNSQGMQHSWIHQQKMPFYNMNSHLSNKLSSWGMESPSSSGSRNFKNDDNGDLNQYARSNDINTTMHTEIAHARSSGKVGESKDAVSLSSGGGSESVKTETSNQKMAREHSYAANFADFMNPNTFRSNMVFNQQLLNRQTVLPFKYVSGPLFVKDKEADQVNDHKQLITSPQEWDPSTGHTNKDSDEAHGHSFGHLNTGHDIDDGRNERGSSLLVRNDQMHLMSSSQKFSDQSDRKSLGSQRFQFHPMGNLETNMEVTNQESHKLHSQGPAHPMNWGLKNQERENFGNSQLAGHAASTNSIDMRKDCFIDSKENSTLAEIPHADTFSGHNPAIPSFSATTAHFSQEKRIGLPSQNVHMLFDKSDQSDDCSSTAKQNISENNSSSGMPEGVASDGPISHLQRIQANHLHGIGLKLAHPPQRQSVVGMHTLAEGTHQAWSSSTSSVALPTIHETSRRENLDYKTVMSPQNSKDMSPQNSKDALYSNTKGNSLGMINNLRNQHVIQQQQLQQQSISYASRQAHFDLSVNQSFGSKVNADGHPKHLHLPQVQDPHVQTSQALFPGMPGKVPSSRFSSFPDNGAPLPSQFYTQESGNSDMINASSDRRNVSQLLHVAETVSANLPSAASVASQQGHFSNIFNNTWRNAATQRSSGLQSQKIPSNLLQSLNPLQLSHQDDQRAKMGGNASSEVGTCSFNSQQLTYAEENPLKGTKLEQKQTMGMGVSPKMGSASEVQEQEFKNISNKSSVSLSTSVRVHQGDKKGKHADNQREKMAFPTVSPSSSDVQTHSYSLLQQMQAMKGTDSDPSKVVSKRLNGSDSVCRGSDAGSQPSEIKMLSFSSREIEERSGNASNHLVIGELASCRPTSCPGLHELQNGSLSSSVLNHTGTNERHLINPQMASSWFEQYGNFKDSQTSGMSDSLGSSQRSTKAAVQHYFLTKTSEQMDNDAMMKRRCDSISENSSPTAVAADSHSSPPVKVPDESLVPVRKKQKIATSDLLSWHKEVTQSSRSLQSFSLAKIEWAQATNRLIEKIEDDAEVMDDLLLIRPKRRLVLTTQLTQQLFPPVPTKFLFQDSAMSYESVIYYLTRLTLGEACNLISVLGSDSGLQLESRNMISEKNNTPKKKREEFFSNIVDNFIMRLRRLQNNLLRLEGGSTVVDFRMECQDVERGSIINRFARFHGRGPTDGIDGSSASETVPRRSFPQRNVTVLPMPRNLPDGVICLSL